MTIRILSLAAAMALFTQAIPMTAHANEEAAPEAAFTNLDDQATMELETTLDPGAAPWRPEPPRWEPPRRGRLVCYARNATGRTFAAWGNWRAPRHWVQREAMQNCRQRSGFFRFTCREAGCRVMR